MQVHLALPAAVSVTSSDIVEIDADNHVLGGGRVGFAANCKPESRGLKTAAAAVRLTTISEADYQRLSDATITVPHWDSQWMWAPGTANMFRKHALDVTLPQVSRLTLHVGFEGYFCPILHLMTGSALICRPLSAYRIHGRNTFSSAPSMRAARITRGVQSKGPSVQKLAVLHTILSRADTFDVIFAGDRFWSTIDLLPRLYGTTRRAYFANNEVREVIAENFHSLIKARGARTLITELAQRLDFRSISGLLRTAYENDVPPSLRWALMKGKVRRLLPSLRMARLRWAVMKEKVRRLRPSLRLARSSGLKEEIVPRVPNRGAATDASIDTLGVVAWRTNLIQETIRWANERRPTRKACNICGFSGYFQPHWFPVRPEAKCPECSSLERHRLLKLWFDHHADLFNGAESYISPPRSP